MTPAEETVAYHRRQGKVLPICSALERYQEQIDTADQYAEIRRVMARRDMDQKIHSARVEGVCGVLAVMAIALAIAWFSR